MRVRGFELRSAGCVQILANQLTLSQPEGAYYARQITIGTRGFSDLPLALPLHYQVLMCEDQDRFSKKIKALGWGI